MENLKPCPCGETPTTLIIIDSGSAKWAYVCGDCCGEWNIEFRTQYFPLATEECMALAKKAWNRVPRKHLKEGERWTKQLE